LNNEFEFLRNVARDLSWDYAYEYSAIVLLKEIIKRTVRIVPRFDCCGAAFKCICGLQSNLGY
jgi:hypothetical protein